MLLCILVYLKVLSGLQPKRGQGTSCSSSLSVFNSYILKDKYIVNINMHNSSI